MSEDRKEYLKQYREDNKEKIKEYKKQYAKANKEKLKEYKKQYYEANKEKVKESQKIYTEANKEKIKERSKQYYIKNKEKIKIRSNTNYKKNKKEILKKQKISRPKYEKENRFKINKRKRIRRAADPLLKMSGNLRKRTWSAFKTKGYKKTSKTQEMLGVDWEVCKAHIERQFKKGMKWSNYGEWHIDHIIPLASAKNERQLRKLCHYRNLQPLDATDNMSKSDKIIGQQSFMRL